MVAETWDGFLNDVNGFHVTEADTVAALENAKSGPIPGRQRRRRHGHGLLRI